MKTLFTLFVSCLLLLTACTNEKAQTVKTDEYYTCSMHPQIMQDKPGTCPICHMDLIVVKKTQTASGEISLNDEQIRLGNIKTDTIRKGMIGDKTVLTATLNTDETNMTSINARIMGRIDHLYFKAMGDYVPKGAHLYDLYSEELNNAKQEYLVFLEKQKTLGNTVIDFSRMVQSAKTKLLLWGMTEKQVADLASSGKASTLTSFYSNASGYVSELSVSEGQFVTEGSTLIKLSGLSSLWAEAQVYTSEMSGMDMNGMATVMIPDFPGKEWKGKIAFANPEIMSDSRLNLLRISIPNTDGKLKPGMHAYVNIKNREQQSLTLPTNAVLRDGKMNLVWIKSGKNSFTMKMVETGLESGDRIEIKGGLQSGDVIVLSGAYLLYSEYVFKKGGNPMEGMHMGSH